MMIKIFKKTFEKLHPDLGPDFNLRDFCDSLSLMYLTEAEVIDDTGEQWFAVEPDLYDDDDVDSQYMEEGAEVYNELLSLDIKKVLQD